MLDTGNYYRKIIKLISTVAISTLLITVCLSNSYQTQSTIGLCVGLLLFCVIGLFYNMTALQYLRPIILLMSLVYFGFISGGCNCILFYFQSFILFLLGKTAFWIGFTTIVIIVIFSVVFGPIWCGWICCLGALQEFIFKKNKWKLLKLKKAQKKLIYIQTIAFVASSLWVLFAQRPVFCAYDPFISIFKLKIYNWIGYITVPLLLISSLFIYRPFCRILCPIGWLLYIVKLLPFAAKLKLVTCTDCKKCHSHCKLNAIHGKKIENTCNLCGECKITTCPSITLS